MKNRYTQLLKPILLIITAILILFNPGEALLLLTSYLGILALAYGIVSIMNKHKNDKRNIYSRRGYLEGAGGIILGIIFLIHSENIINLFMIIFGLIILAISILQLNIFRKLKNFNFRSGAMLTSAILSFSIAIICLFNPFHSATIITILIGSYILLYGIYSLLINLGVLKRY